MSEVKIFSRYNLSNIPESLRLLAHKIEVGEVDAERIVVAIDGGMEAGFSHVAFGEEPFTNAHAIGMLFAASQDILGRSP